MNIYTYICIHYILPLIFLTKFSFSRIYKYIRCYSYTCNASYYKYKHDISTLHYMIYIDGFRFYILQQGYILCIL